jgi:Putative beta-barrel porin-2, OmpL-like. bbp2
MQSVFFILIIFFTLTLPSTLLAQGSFECNNLTQDCFVFGGFIDTYLAHDSSNAEDYRLYTTQASIDDELRVNLGHIDLKYTNPNFRGRLAVQSGDSVKSNYSSEKYIFWRYIQESSWGYKINDKLWIDLGIYPSHIGLESFISRDNWNYTRSLVAEYSPYYETGIKFTYEHNDNLSTQVHLLKGWQNISQEKDPALGMQVSWSPNDKTTLTYNNFLGNESGLRIFNELLVKYKISEKFDIAAQFDIGNQNQPNNQGNATWHGCALLTKYQLMSKISLGGRVERYFDPSQVLVTTPSGENFNTMGFSSNIDYTINVNLLWRNEYKILQSQNDVFIKNEDYHSSNHLLTTSLSYSF